MTYLPQEVIRKKRDGQELTAAEIKFMVNGITDGSLSDAQLGAFAMAVFQQGMTRAERVNLTLDMMHSGSRLQWQDLHLNGPVVDKHSTGGVGDKVSLMLAPIVAACGGYVPMISGRGLGHTGGTLDKLDSIPDYHALPDPQHFRQIVQQVGCAIIGQTKRLAPADQRLYAIRDVTATIESIDLITASILSKKLASGLDALVMDIKTGDGAFAADLSMAKALAESIATVSIGAGVPVCCLITDMNQVLGHSVGNAVEVQECVDLLLQPQSPSTDSRLRQLTLTLAAHMVQIGGLQPNYHAAFESAKKALYSGAAATVFGHMVTALGGPADFLERAADHLPRAPLVIPIPAPKSGYVGAMAVRDIGLALVRLKAGRQRVSDAIDLRVGLHAVVQRGDWVEAGAPLAFLHAVDSDSAALAQQQLIAAIQLLPQPPEAMPLVLDTIISQGEGT